MSDDLIRELKEKWAKSSGERSKPMSPSEQMKATMIRRATDARVLGRSCESLLGICAGEMADGILNDEEIRFLNVWLNEHGDIAYTWPGEVIYARVREALRDGFIDEKERQYLHDSLKALIGGTLQDTGAVFGQATSLPIEENCCVQVAEHCFCFTGEFLYGTRSACQRAVQLRNGTVAERVTFGLDYLVIGTMTSEAWISTTHGRKIEKAVAYRKRGAKVHIVGESQWVAALGWDAEVGPALKGCRGWGGTVPAFHCFPWGGMA